jgi:Fur family ferric uptake transcriptional regulator
MSRLERLCLEKGLKMTDQRRVIARVLSEADDHPDAEELHRRASAVDPRISIATVYRTVRLFEEASILERHDFGDGRARYETIPEEHHDHLIDMRNGTVIEFQNIVWNCTAFRWISPRTTTRTPARPDRPPRRRPARALSGIVRNPGTEGHAPVRLFTHDRLPRWPVLIAARLQGMFG